LGDLKVTNQPLFVGTSVNLPIFKGSKWDGIVGLGYWFD